MKALNQYPMARILFPFMGGIFLAPILFFNIAIWLIILGTLLLLSIFWLFASKHYRNYRRRWINGFLITSLFFVLGIIGFWVHSPLNRQNHYSHFINSSAYRIEIESAFTETSKTFKSTGRVKAVFLAKDSTWHATNGEILLYFQKQEEFSLRYGDEIISTSKLNPLQKAQNPYAFDYAHYMQRKGIFDQSFIKENDWQRVDSSAPKNMQTLAIHLRAKLLGILNNLQYDDENRALAAALLIGYDEYLDDDLRSRFAGSGAMHILCVSGLHVGIIYMLCNFLLSFLGKIKFGNELKIILILATIWFYALITGLSPSVMRASTMITFIVLGKSFNRKGNTYNSLAASAFLLLLFDPNLIYNIGFQLSYGAVFAILYIQPKIFNLFYIGNPILSKIWALLSVSVAAQMGTFPLAVYYFHQFPNYFLLTNLWVIPLAFIVVSGGIVVLLIGILGLSTSFLGLIASALLNYSLISLNKGVEMINLLPNAVSDNLGVSMYDVMLLYVFLFALSTFLFYKQRMWFFSILGSAFLLIVSSIIINTNILKSNTWIVYKANGYSAMDFITEHKSILIGDSAFVLDQQKQKFILTENHIKHRIKECIPMLEFQKTDSIIGSLNFYENIILFNSLRILYLDKAEKEQIFDTPLTIDFVVIAGNTNVNLTELQKKFNFGTIIFDSSNSWWRIKQLKSEAETLGISYWDVNEKGAFVFSRKNPLKKSRGSL